MGLSITHTYYCIRCRCEIERTSNDMMCEKCNNVVMRRNAHIIRWYTVNNRKLAALWEEFRD